MASEVGTRFVPNCVFYLLPLILKIKILTVIDLLGHKGRAGESHDGCAIFWKKKL